MPKNVQTVRKPNDDLFVMTHDGDIYHDDKVRQEMGLLISDRNRWALPITPAAPLDYRLVRLPSGNTCVLS